MPVELPPLPPRIAALPRDRRGYPVPWFLARRGEDADFALADPEKVGVAHRRKLCWICGQQLGAFLCFPVGPMCTLNRISAEPPSHLQCAAFAAVACPFLVRPRMRRAPKQDGAVDPPGDFVDRNPGVVALWSTRSCGLMQVRGGALFELGDPTAVAWYKEGRAATLAEVSESIAAAMPQLREQAEKEGEWAMQELLASVQALLPLLPRAAEAA